MEKVFVGIDPGSNESAIGVISEVGKYIEGIRFSEWTPYQYKQELERIKNTYDIQLVAIEKVGVMPHQGISSSGKFMKATGMIIGMLVALNIPFVEIAPQTWKKLSPTLASNKEDTAVDKKRKALDYAQRRFPEAKLTKAIEHNVAEALCISEWLMLTRKGLTNGKRNIKITTNDDK